MKQLNNGQTLHTQLTECLASNSVGLSYAQCSRECSEANYWVIDGGKNECFSAQRMRKAQHFEVKSIGANGTAKKSWLVCVDEGLVTNQKSNSLPRCDNLLFNSEVFYFIEAKMGVTGNQWKKEFDDAIKNKIPMTKSILDSALGKKGYSITQKIGIVIPYPGINYRVPRTNSQKGEVLRLEAMKQSGKWVSKLILSEVVLL